MNSSPRSRSKSCEPIYVLDDSILYRLEIWSEQEWTNLSTDRRPCKALQAPGLGWIGLMPIPEMNSHPPALEASDRARAEMNADVRERLA